MLITQVMCSIFYFHVNVFSLISMVEASSAYGIVCMPNTVPIDNIFLTW